MLGILYYASSRTWIYFIAMWAFECACVCVFEQDLLSFIAMCAFVCVCMCEDLFYVRNIHIT